MSAHSHPGQQPPTPQPLPGVNAIIAVGSGKGGVGKTTLSVNLAIALSKMGHKVGLLDGDVYGPNVPLMLGTNEHKRDVGPVDVAVEQSNFVAHLAKSDCEIDRESRLADSSFAGTNRDDSVDAR